MKIIFFNYFLLLSLWCNAAWWGEIRSHRGSRESCKFFFAADSKWNIKHWKRWKKLLNNSFVAFFCVFFHLFFLGLMLCRLRSVDFRIHRTTQRRLGEEIPSLFRSIRYLWNIFRDILSFLDATPPAKSCISLNTYIQAPWPLRYLPKNANKYPFAHLFLSLLSFFWRKNVNGSTFIIKLHFFSLSLFLEDLKPWKMEKFLSSLRLDLLWAEADWSNFIFFPALRCKLQTSQPEGERELSSRLLSL